MKIHVYPIQSDLHDAERVSEASKKLLSAMSEETGWDIAITELPELYDADLSLILIQTGGSEGKFLKMSDSFKPPIYLLTYGENNSLAASLEILSYLKQRKIQGEILHGNSSYLVKRIKNIASRKVRLGVIGKPSDWLISSDVDPERVREVLNADFIAIDIKELIEESMKAPEQDTSAFDYDSKELQKALKIHYALKNLARRYALSGLTVRCFDLLNTVCSTSCLSFGILNSEGISASCEGDIPALLTMEVIRRVTGQSSFQCNPSKIDASDNTMILAHCTLPLDLCESYVLDSHFESGIGVAIKGELKESEITILKLSADLKHYYVSSGKILKNLNDRSRCRTQIEVALDEDVSYFLKNPLGNHHVICYGNHADEISDYLSSLNFTKVQY